MKPFMDQDFLLRTETARELYHSFAAPMPILDYHCHIDPREIAEDRQFDNITQVWLSGDHYKWRQMRSNGVDEYYITGDAPDREKFQKWAETLDKAIGNPCSTGATWSSSATSATPASWGPTPPRRSGSCATPSSGTPP